MQKTTQERQAHKGPRGQQHLLAFGFSMRLDRGAKHWDSYHSGFMGTCPLAEVPPSLASDWWGRVVLALVLGKAHGSLREMLLGARPPWPLFCVRGSWLVGGTPWRTAQAVEINTSIGVAHAPASLCPKGMLVIARARDGPSSVWWGSGLELPSSMAPLKGCGPPPRPHGGASPAASFRGSETSQCREKSEMVAGLESPVLTAVSSFYLGDPELPGQASPSHGGGRWGNQGLSAGGGTSKQDTVSPAGLR